MDVVPATLSQVQDYLATVPAAHASWAEGFVTMAMPLALVRRVVETMAVDAKSPLRAAEDGVMAEEVRRVQLDRGMHVAGSNYSGKTTVRIGASLSASDQTRVLRLAGAFCQPLFRPTARFVSNSHSVANAVRRCTSAYLLSRIPTSASVLEVGPDEREWLLATSDDLWQATKEGRYKGARPIVGPRDSVRAGWKTLAKVVAENRDGGWKASQQERAALLLESVESVFPRVKVEGFSGSAEYIVSCDANYDVGFHDMPDCMGAVGARVWLGSMSRAKGLTRCSRVDQGSLDLMGTDFRVDWPGNVIRFSQYGCPAYGYNHKVSDFMLYEEHNGYVWDARGDHYVYTKMPETNAELLMFAVIRVPGLLGVAEPRYVENPRVGTVRLSSIWAVGGDVSGVPTAFEKVVFNVDALNFEKVLEKRRMLDFKGTYAVSLSYVRSVNVRFWLNGVPVSSTERIASKLAEATAVVVEVLAARDRLGTGIGFRAAMGQHSVSVKRDGWCVRMLSELFDFRAAVGKVVGPVVNNWSAFRGGVADAALSTISDIVVSVAQEPPHLPLGVSQAGVSLGPCGEFTVSELCVCARLGDARAALTLATGGECAALRRLVAHLESRLPCAYCADQQVAALTSFADEVESADSSTAVDSGSSSSDGDGSDEGSQTSISEVSDACSGPGGFGSAWADEPDGSAYERAAMEECVALENHLMVTALSESRIDSLRVLPGGVASTTRLLQHSTTRVRHAALRFEAGRCVDRRPPDAGTFGALYDLEADAIVPIKLHGDLMRASVHDGWHYTSSRLKVWNAPEIVAAVQGALDYGHVKAYRREAKVTLGVPGAGKTYGLVRKLADDWTAASIDDMVLCVTNKAVEEAQAYASKFGLPDKFVRERMMTLDRYLLHCKKVARVLCVDEFTMVHMGRIDAAVVLARPMEVRLTGDARQIQYDPFAPTFDMQFARLGDSVSIDNVVFLHETHRLTVDTCAAFVDQYPLIHPCSCCRKGERDVPSLSWTRVSSLGDFVADDAVRHHVYTQDEKEDLRVTLNFHGSADELRSRPVGGLSTVGEDQGSTHEAVRTFRTVCTYDKAAKVKKQSLFNRVEFVLTDMTRHRRSYEYVTMSDEKDEIIARVEMSRDPARLAAVRERRSYRPVTVLDLLR